MVISIMSTCDIVQCSQTVTTWCLGARVESREGGVSCYLDPASDTLLSHPSHQDCNQLAITRSMSSQSSEYHNVSLGYFCPLIKDLWSGFVRSLTSFVRLFQCVSSEVSLLFSRDTIDLQIKLFLCSLFFLCTCCMSACVPKLIAHCFCCLDYIYWVLCTAAGHLLFFSLVLTPKFYRIIFI